MNHDNIVLVAPRPVRLAAPVPYSQFSLHRPQAAKASTAVRFVSAPTDAFERLRMSADPEEESVPPSKERDRPVSPRTSLSTPHSEAIEEFLSILRPSSFLFPPNSPILRPSNQIIAHGFVPYRRPASSALSPALSNEGLGLTLADQSDNVSKENGELVMYPFKLLGSNQLSSPGSRSRNSFPRHPSDSQMAAFMTQHTISNSPSPALTTLSPATVPLPMTPDETDSELS